MSTDIKLDESLPAVREVNVQALISQAIEKGTNIDVMERLFAMAEKWKAMEARDEYFAALAAFQAECPIIAKTKIVRDKSGKERYRYAPLDDIVAQVRDLLKQNGFSYTIDTEQPNGKLIAYCDSHHTGGHSERTRLEVPVGSEYMSAQQMVGAARTYAMRYVFCNAFGILTGDEDNDATTTEGDGGEGTAAPSEPAPDGSTSNPYECPECHKFAVIKGAPQYGGGWVCWKKKGGCGQKWDDLAWAAASSKGPSAEMQEAVLAADAEPIDVTPEKPAHTTPKWPGPATAWDAARVAATPKWPDPAKPKQTVADPEGQKKAAAALNQAMKGGPSKADEAEARDLF